MLAILPDIFSMGIWIQERWPLSPFILYCTASLNIFTEFAEPVNFRDKTQVPGFGSTVNSFVKAFTELLLYAKRLCWLRGQPRDLDLSLCLFYSPRKPSTALSFKMWPAHQNPVGSSQLWIKQSFVHPTVIKQLPKMSLWAKAEWSLPSWAYSLAEETDINQIIIMKHEILILVELWMKRWRAEGHVTGRADQFRSSESDSWANRVMCRSYGGKGEGKNPRQRNLHVQRPGGAPLRHITLHAKLLSMGFGLTLGNRSTFSAPQICLESSRNLRKLKQSQSTHFATMD